MGIDCSIRGCFGGPETRAGEATKEGRLEWRIAYRRRKALNLAIAAHERMAIRSMVALIKELP